MAARRPLILLAFHWYLESLHEGASRRLLELGYETAVLNSDSAGTPAVAGAVGILGMFAQSPAHPVRRFADNFGGSVVEFSLAFSENKTWGRVPEDCEKIGRRAAERLASLPAASFLFLDGGPWWNHDLRWAAFRAFSGFGARPCERFHAGGMDAAAAERVAAKLRDMPKPVAIFGSVDEWARLAYDGAEIAGLRVPGDVFILGFGNRELVSRVAPVPISSIDIDYRAWAASGAEFLHDMIRGEAAPGSIRAFPPGGVIERVSTAGEAGGDPLCLRALALMRARVGVPPDVPELARLLGVSKATLERAFLAHVGTGVSRRFLEIRIEAAKPLLINGDKTESVAASVGFDSARGFTQAFTRVVGTTPGRFAEQRRR